MPHNQEGSQWPKELTKSEIYDMSKEKLPNIGSITQAPEGYLRDFAKASTSKNYIGCKIIAAEPMTK